MAVVTLKGHVSRAMNFYDLGNIHFGIGRTTPWTDELNPPVPTNTDILEEVVGYKLVESRFLVVPATNNEGYQLTYRDTKWRIVPYDSALEQGARWVYLLSYIAYDEFPLDIVYRQIGVFTRLTVKNTVSPSKSALLASEVQSPGILEILDNRKPIYRELDQREKLAVIIEF